MISLPTLEQIAERGGLSPRGRQAWGPCPVCGAETVEQDRFPRIEVTLPRVWGRNARSTPSRVSALDLAPCVGQKLTWLTGCIGTARPCPVCGAETRGRGERRGPLSFQAGNLWKCWAGGCNAGGDALGLLAALRFQTIPPKGDARWHALLMELEGKSIWHQIPKPLTKLEIPAAVFPPHLQVQQLWQACITLDDPKAMQSVAFRWLADYRKLDPISMGALHLARILPRHLPEWPDWIPTLGIPRQNWLGIYRLVTPLYDATGLLRALRFRAVDRWWQAGQWLPPQGCHQDDRGTLFFGSQRLPKALSPRGGTRGLVMADPIAQSLLAGQNCDAAGVSWDGWVLITEGEPDWWAVSTPRDRFLEAAHQKQTFAAFSIGSGSWTSEIANRIPNNAHVRIWTDHDDAGEKYAETIHRSLMNRCDVQRVKRPSVWGNIEKDDEGS